MARQYKKNRARGSRQSTYTKKIFLGYKLPKLTEVKTKEDYIKSFIKQNKEELEYTYEKRLNEAYKVGGAKIYAKRKAQIPDIETMVDQLFRAKDLSIKNVKAIIESNLANISILQSSHIGDLLMSDDAFYEELMFRIKSINPKEEFDPKRLSYNGDGVYSYTTKSGIIIRFRFRSYSPAILEFVGG